jgi:uncharacterized membrane protein YbhN (UPF0104 family)
MTATTLYAERATSATATATATVTTGERDAAAGDGDAASTAGDRDAEVAAPGRRRSARPGRRWPQIALAVAGAAVLVLVLRGRIPSLADLTAAATGAQGRWVLAAGVAQAVSIGMFARQQQRLLRAFGVRVGIGRMTAITYARSAISVSMPAGAAISAGYAFRQYRTQGASQRTAATVMILSGVVSTAALVGLAAAGAGLTTAPAGWPVTAGTVLYATLAIAAVAVIAAAATIRLRHRWPALGSVVSSVLGSVRRAADSATTVRRRDWLLAALFSALNWLADLLCLVAAARAVGVIVPLAALGGAYLVAQAVRQIPITPGGIGVIEASLLVALVSAGAAQAPATAAVLIYRIVSCWAIVPIGLALWAALQARGARLPLLGRARPAG